MIIRRFCLLAALLSLTGCAGNTTTDCPLSAQWWYHSRYPVAVAGLDGGSIRPNPSTINSLASISRGR